MKSKRLDKINKGRIIYLSNNPNSKKWVYDGIVGRLYLCINTKTSQEKLFCGSKRVFVKNERNKKCLKSDL